MPFWNSYLVLAATGPILSLTWESREIQSQGKQRSRLVWSSLRPLSCKSLFQCVCKWPNSSPAASSYLQKSHWLGHWFSGMHLWYTDQATLVKVRRSLNFHLSQQAVSCLWQDTLPVLTPFLPILFASLCKIRTLPFFVGKKPNKYLLTHSPKWVYSKHYHHRHPPPQSSELI